MDPPNFRQEEPPWREACCFCVHSRDLDRHIACYMYRCLVFLYTRCDSFELRVGGKNLETTPEERLVLDGPWLKYPPGLESAKLSSQTKE
jgi:hypothetical protein